MRRDYLWLALLLAAVAAVPRLIGNQYYLTVLVVIGINLILVLGLNLVMGYAGQISLGHAGFFGLGAYLSMVLTSTQTPLEDWLKSFSWTPEFLVLAGGALHRFTAGHMVVAAALAAAMTGAVALVVGIPTLKLKGHYLAMATLGLGIIIQIVFKEEAPLTGGPSGMGVPYLKVWGREIDPNTPAYYYLVWGLVAVAILLSIHLVHSRIGRALRAIHEDEMAAAVCGVPVMRLKVMVFTLSAVYASLAGSLYAHYLTHVNPSPFGFMFSVKLVVMVVVGGMGSIWGSVLGSALLTILPQLLTVLQDYETVCFAAILILVLMFAPQGLAGLLEAGRRRLQGADS
jgi:branched-chain amino acid transport system permease protein